MFLIVINQGILESLGMTPDQISDLRAYGLKGGVCVASAPSFDTASEYVDGVSQSGGFEECKYESRDVNSQSGQTGLARTRGIAAFSCQWDGSVLG